jgi:predicted acyltransferase
MSVSASDFVFNSFVFCVCPAEMVFSASVPSRHKKQVIGIKRIKCGGK